MVKCSTDFESNIDEFSISGLTPIASTKINPPRLLESKINLECKLNQIVEIGDGTAGFYNYTYYTVAGFTEHDTFRSNQIREGQLTRKKALELVKEENRPRYQNIRWYLDTIGIDYDLAINAINNMQKLY